MSNGWTCCNTNVKHQITCKNYVSPWIEIKSDGSNLPKEQGEHLTINHAGTIVKMEFDGTTHCRRFGGRGEIVRREALPTAPVSQPQEGDRP